MELIPAIDIRDGRCVRLLHGDFDRETRYELDPRALARRYRDAGADWLHIVDLDGAASGRRKNAALIGEIARAADIKVQLGGGIRSEASLNDALDYVDRVVIGSLAVTSPDLVRHWLAQFGPDRIVLALDVRLDADGTAHVATHGWSESSALTLDEAVSGYAGAGLRHVLCTDVARDGALSGPNVELYRDLSVSWPAIAIQASGGVRDADDLAALAGAGAAAAIAGKALLEGRIRFEEIKRFLPNA